MILLLLWLSIILLYIHIYHIFFIHSSVNGHLGCFHPLAIVNSAAINRWMHGSFLIMFFSGYLPRSGIAGLYGSSIFSFWRNLLYRSPEWLHRFTFPPTVKEGYLLATSSLAFTSFTLGFPFDPVGSLASSPQSFPYSRVFGFLNTFYG